jgi:hypothetical protein
MLRTHARSDSGLCTDRLTHGTQVLTVLTHLLTYVLTVLTHSLTHSGTHVCPQSANDDRPKLRHVAPDHSSTCGAPLHRRG